MGHGMIAKAALDANGALGHNGLIFIGGGNMVKKVFTAQQAKEIGDKLGIGWRDFDVEQFRMGLDVELEHGRVDSRTNVTDDDPVMTGKIAWAHLIEIHDYYDRLYKMEAEAES